MPTKYDRFKRLFYSIFENTKKQPRLTKRSLQLESLENRELLTVVGFQPDSYENGQVGYFAADFIPVVTIIDCYNVKTGNTLQPPNGLLGNRTDATIALVDEPAHGTLQLLDDGTFTFTPDTDYVGTDSFRYEILNDDSVTEFGRVLINIVPDIGHVSLPPLGGSTIPTTPQALDFLSNDTATVFTPPVFVTGSNSVTITTQESTSLETDVGILAGTITQTLDTSVAVQKSSFGWLYSELVVMSYTESYDA